MSKILAYIRQLSADRRGVTALEYGMIAAFIAVGLVAVVPGIGTKLVAAFTSIATALPAGT